MSTQQNLQSDLIKEGRAEMNMLTANHGSCTDQAWVSNATDKNLLDAMRNLCRLLKLHMEGYQKAMQKSNFWFLILSSISVLCATATPVVEAFLPVTSSDDIQFRRQVLITFGAVNTFFVSLNGLMRFQRTTEQNSMAASQYTVLLNEYNVRFGYKWSCYVRGEPVDAAFREDFKAFHQHCVEKIMDLSQKTPILPLSVRNEIRKIGEIDKKEQQSDPNHCLLDDSLRSLSSHSLLSSPQPILCSSRSLSPSNNHKHDASQNLESQSLLGPERCLELPAQERQPQDVQGTALECMALSVMNNSCHKDQPQLQDPGEHAMLSRRHVQWGDISNAGGFIQVDAQPALESLKANGLQQAALHTRSSTSDSQFEASNVRRRSNSLPTRMHHARQSPCHDRFGVWQELGAERV